MLANQSIENPTAPEAPLAWDKEDLLPEKPADAEYGYLQGKSPHPCTKDELIARCQSKGLMHQIRLVWHPGAPRLVPVSQVDFLFEVLKEKAIASKRSLLGFTIFQAAIWALMLFMVSNQERQNWHLFMLVVFGVIPLCEHWFSLRKLKRSQWEENSTQIRGARFAVWMDMQRAWFTGALLGIILLISVSQLFVGLQRSVDLAGLNKQAVWAGEWWRLFTAVMLHAGPLHLILNASALFVLGKFVEVTMSRFHMLLVFLISALLGSVFSLLFLEATSLGASGGILGFVGFLWVLGYRQKNCTPSNFAKSLAISILILAAIGIVGASFIDNAAHLGGLVGGMLLGMILIPKKNITLPLTPSPSIRVVGLISLTLLIICACVILKLFFFRS